MQPNGKAIWLRRWRTIGGGSTASPAAWLARYKRAGFRWAAPIVLTGNGASRVAKNREPGYWRAMRDDGMPCWGTWILPNPASGSLLAETDRLAAELVDLGATGLLIDPEREFLNRRADAARFAEKCRSACEARGLGYAFTSYSVPSYHPSFPWSEFAASGPLFALAQTYDREMQFDPSYPVRALASYREHGFPIVYPCAGLWNHRDRKPKTPAELARHLRLLPDSGAVCVWPTPSIAEPVWRVLSSWQLQRTGGSGAGFLALLAGLALAGLALKG